MMKGLHAICLTIAVCLAFAGCGKTKDDGSKFYINKDEPTKPVAQKVSTAYPDKEVGFQLEEPKEGEKIAIITTDLGDIYIRLFPEAAPKAVGNFIGLIEKGSYNNIIFHRVINNFMIQGGDFENQNGTGGKSIWGGEFEDEFDSKLLNLRGALAMANAGANSNGSQFFINQAPASKFDRTSYNYDDMYNYYKQYYDYAKSQNPQVIQYYPNLSSFIKAQGGINPLDYTVPEDVWKVYEKTGGNINLDGAFRSSGGHTVFGQVFKGMDVVDKIAAVETDENDKPKTDVKIISAKVTEYAK